MARDISPEQARAAGAPVVYPAMLVELDVAPDALCLWGGLGNLVWGNRVFTGAGALLGIGDVEEAAEVRAASTTISLSGIPGEVIEVAQTVAFQGRAARIWLALLAEDGALIGDPVQILAGRMDTLSWSEGETAAVSMTVENQLVDLDRARVRRYTDADQQAEYAGDLGFQYVASLVEKEITWGRG